MIPLLCSVLAYRIAAGEPHCVICRDLELQSMKKQNRNNTELTGNVPEKAFWQYWLHIFRECPLCQALSRSLFFKHNDRNTRTFLSAGWEGFYQLECVYEIDSRLTLFIAWQREHSFKICIVCGIVKLKVFFLTFCVFLTHKSMIPLECSVEV